MTYDLFGYDVEMPQTHNGQDVSDILKASFNRTKEQINHRYATQAPLLIRRWNGPGQTGIDPEEQAIDRLNSGVEGYFRQAMAHSVVSTSISDFSDESTVRPVARQIHLLFDTLEAERNNLFQSPQLSDNKRERYKQLKNNKTYCLTEAAALYILNANWPKILMPRLKWDGEKNLNPASILEKGFNARRLLALAFLVEPDSWKQEVYTFIAGDVSIDRSSFEETSVQIVVVDFKKFPEIFRTLGGGPVFPEWYSGTIIVSNFPTNEKERAKSAAKTLSDKLLWLRYFLKICEAMTEQIVHGQYWTMLAGMANDRKFLNAFNNSIDGFHRLASSGLNARQALEAQITDEMLVRLHGIAFILRSKGEDNFAVVLDDIAYAYQLYQIDEARLVTLNPYTWASAAYKGAVSPPCAREGHTERNLFTAEFLRNAIETYWGITDSSLKDDIIKTAILFQMREGTLTENIIDTIFRNQRIIIDLPEKVFNYTQAYKDRFGTELGSTQDFLQEFGNGQQSNEERIMILNGLAGMLKSGSDSVRSSVRWVLGEILFNSLKLERYEDVLQNNIEARLVAPEGPSQIYMAYNNLDNQLSKDLLGEYFESIVNEDALYQERSIHKNYDGAVWLFNMIRLSKLIEEDRIDAAKFLYLKSLAGDRSLIINIFGCLSSEQYGHTSAFRVKARALLMYTVTLESYGALPYPGSRVRIMQDVDFTN